MAFLKKLDQFLHRNAVLIAGYGISAASIALALPEAFFLDRLKKRNGRLVENDEVENIDPVTETLLDKVLVRMNIRANEEEGIQTFVCKGQDPMHRGSLKLSSGAIIGFPRSFSYQNEEDIEKSDLTVRDLESIDWSSHPGIALKQAILLSEREKAFAIAKEINCANSYHILLKNTLRACFAMIAYMSGHLLARIFKFRSILKLWARGTVYGIVGVTNLGLYAWVANKHDMYLQTSSDEATAELSPYYAIGGVEYYEKLLQRNRALRTLLGPKGEEIYSKTGNLIDKQVGFTGLNITNCRDNMQQMVEKWHNGEIKRKPKVDQDAVERDRPFQQLTFGGRQRKTIGEDK